MAARKRLDPAEQMKSIGVNFRARTRAELELLAAGRKRTVGWCIRDAVEAQMIADHAELQQYALIYPELAAKIAELSHSVPEDEESGS